MPTPEELDHTPLTFGKYRGMTPSAIAEVDPSYLRWMYENVKDKQTCSKLLYDDCKDKKDPKIKSYYKAAPRTSTNLRDSFDHYDDDTID